ncbi:MAG TPA: AMP-binding protein [Desulfobacteria bacterium]|nr:AMP-binding protein [Desulfobacteria bacterium]
MNHPEITPLESWIASKIGLNDGRDLTMETLARYQLQKINATIRYASRNSPFYKELLSGDSSGSLSSLRDLSRLPFTSAEDIRCDPYQFLCVSQDRVSRVVTLRTSGTTQSPKRIFFTDSDLELTIDFFHHGMSTLVRPGQRVLILMPGELPGSVGDLLTKGLARMSVLGFVHGPIEDNSEVVNEILHKKIDCLVGIPAQVMSLARSIEGSTIGSERIKSVLLSADYVPKPVIRELERIWECKVFQHYGMTETGLGGGVECEAFSGYHLREADLYYEIIDPVYGRPVSDGKTGEVVFTTLTREAMPLIRYRTGDLASLIPAPCPCDSILKRMSPVRGRVSGVVSLVGTQGISMSDLDEAIFAVSGVMSYQAEICALKGRDHLKISVYTEMKNSAFILERVHDVVMAIPLIRDAVARKAIQLDRVALGPTGRPTTGVVKRGIVDLRDKANAL